jgi:SAM-dependent methyltransferase
VSRYGAHVLPRLTRLWLGGGLLATHRSALLAQVAGRVLEVGIGSGTSLPHYPAGVRHLVGLDVSAAALGMASRSRQPDFPVALVRGSIEHPPLKDGSFDFVVTTWLLCLLPDPVLALTCMRRLLVPGGKLVFIEHGLAGTAAAATLQSFLTPATTRLCGGCRLNRRIDQFICDAGFRIEHLQNRRLDPFGLLTLYAGSAVRDGAPATGAG